MGFDSSFLTKRAHMLEVSGIRKFFDLIQSMPNAINLSIGMVHYDVPDELKEVAFNAIKEGKNTYSVTQGLPDVREKVKEYLIIGTVIDAFMPAIRLPYPQVNRNNAQNDLPQRQKNTKILSDLLLCALVSWRQDDNSMAWIKKNQK